MFPPQPLERLVYISRAARPIDADMIDDIALVSRIDNGRADITGHLYYTDHGFVQLLEGRRGALDHLRRGMTMFPDKVVLACATAADYCPDQARAIRA